MTMLVWILSLAFQSAGQVIPESKNIEYCASDVATIEKMAPLKTALMELTGGEPFESNKRYTWSAQGKVKHINQECYYPMQGFQFNKCKMIDAPGFTIEVDAAGKIKPVSIADGSEIPARWGQICLRKSGGLEISHLGTHLGITFGVRSYLTNSSGNGFLARSVFRSQGSQTVLTGEGGVKLSSSPVISDINREVTSSNTSRAEIGQ